MSPLVRDWALRHGVSGQALHELAALMGLRPAEASVPDRDAPPHSEAYVQQTERLRHAAAGGLAWRNNVGAMQDATGRVVRYGLANDSSRLNRVVKMGDLVGINPMVVEARHVGTKIGQFWMRECKPTGWHFTGTEHERAQLRGIEIVLAAGGDAAFTTGER